MISLRVGRLNPSLLRVDFSFSSPTEELLCSTSRISWKLVLLVSGISAQRVFDITREQDKGKAEGRALLEAMVFKIRTLSFSDSNLEEYPIILKKFSLTELRAATQNFSQSNILAQGRCGTLYRGLLPDGSLVAIKRPRNEHPQKVEAQFRAELRFGSDIMARHPNVLHLIGFCRTESEHLLVYPLLTNRTSLNEEIPLLDWATRKKIALGVARGLTHLHRGLSPGIVHRDICSANIWLDQESNPVIGCFTLDLMMNEEDMMGEEGELKQKNDVLAYGSVLLKLVAGERTFFIDQVAEGDSDIFLIDWIKRVLVGRIDDMSRVVDHSLQGNYDEREARLLVHLGLLCTLSNSERRPEMPKVVEMLEDETLVAPLRMSWNDDEYMLDYSFSNLSELKRFSLDELWVATRKFGPSNLLGEGGFSVVYWGKLADGSLVAAKRLTGNTAEDVERQFETEVMIGSNRMAHHPNLLGLIGFCCEKGESLLVYPLMINGNLQNHLRHGRDRKRFPPLDWQTRKQIALGAARGLAHLHDKFVPSIIHRDICPSNILLDVGFEAVVGDFGWARLMNKEETVEGTIMWSFTDDWPISPHLYADTYVNTTVRGTDGYIASEYRNTGKCSLKSDVFAFGNLLLELMTGQQASPARTRTSLECVIHQGLPGGLHRTKWNLDQIIDKDLQGQFNHQEAERLIDIALKCKDRNPSMRPKMGEVVRVIEGL